MWMHRYLLVVPLAACGGKFEPAPHQPLPQLQANTGVVLSKPRLVTITVPASATHNATGYVDIGAKGFASQSLAAIRVR